MQILQQWVRPTDGPDLSLLLHPHASLLLYHPHHASH